MIASKMNAKRRFIPLDVQPVQSKQEDIVIDDDQVEDISDVDDDEFYTLFLQRKKEEFENLMKNDEVFRKQMLAPFEIQQKRSPALTSTVRIIVVNKHVPQQIIKPSTIVIPDNLQEDLFEQAREKRRKERQRIKRKKANKRRYQRRQWQRKIWFDRYKKAPFYI